MQNEVHTEHGGYRASFFNEEYFSALSPLEYPFHFKIWHEEFWASRYIKYYSISHENSTIPTRILFVVEGLVFLFRPTFWNGKGYEAEIILPVNMVGNEDEYEYFEFDIHKFMDFLKVHDKIRGKKLLNVFLNPAYSVQFLELKLISFNATQEYKLLEKSYKRAGLHEKIKEFITNYQNEIQDDK